MDAASFIKESGELAKKLERFGITKARKCAVTLYSGDGICVNYDRSDISRADLHQCLKNAFPSDNYIMSYEVSSADFCRLTLHSDPVLTDASQLTAASDELKALLIQSSEEFPHPAVSGSFHVVYMGSEICIGADSFAALERNAFILEQYVRKLGKLTSIKSEAICFGGKRAADVAMRLEDMDNGRIYIRNKKTEKKR